MNLQKIHNTVTRHLLTQNERSVLYGTNCAYRSPDGLKCAVGCLITNEFYTEDLEQNSVSASVVVDALRQSGIELTGDERNETFTYLRSVQSIHDNAPVEKWDYHLNELAQSYNLQHPKIQ